ncbi:Uma2 family endonuclease [Hymenobacter sp. BRD128]|uniref:Uma2 family endonuclease n=1 Tax=Hymenobacter sp. BRD128 TaxID=2675878 RepID=UPI001567B5FF|nr:Uma2 family endonuclease [Hymenobacter sp. BRD128]QKG57265.1 Uma2 family endonuclease [Hymenobacter sp. BRD128]
MGQAEPKAQYTVAEYQALEAQSEGRHEFFEGELFAMAGESVAHNVLALNIAFACRQAVRGKNCRVVMEGVQLAVKENRHYTYPDVMVSCDPADQCEARTLHNPVLLVEVLSPSTAAYDRALKFNSYKELNSLRHYLLVSQHYWLIEWYRREPDNKWVHAALTEVTDTVEIPELGLTLTLAQVYEEAGVAPLRATPAGPEEPA